jgi:hypothetical protein
VTNTCVACTLAAPGVPDELLRNMARLRAQAEHYAALARDAKRQADEAEVASEAERERRDGHPWVCDAHREHLHDPVLRQRWVGGWLGHPKGSLQADMAIAQVRAYIADPDHQPGIGGACMVCRPGTRHREEALQ